MRRGHHRERGAALVELALLLPVFALLVFGTVDVARAYRLNIRLESAAREGVSFSQIYPNDVTCTGAANDVKDRVQLEDPDLPTHPGYAVTAHRDVGGGTFAAYDICASDGSDPELVDPGDRVRVDVSATFDVITPFVGAIIGDPIGMSGSAEVVTQG